MINKKYNGRYENGYAWMSFTTGSKEIAKYYVTLQNLTAGSKKLVGRVYDEYGTVLAASQSSWMPLWMDAESDGTARFMMFDFLKPETTYYIMIEGEGKAEYQIGVSDKE